MDCGLLEFSCHYDSVMLSIVQTFAAIPIPTFLQNGITIPDSIAWVASVVKLAEGLGLLFAALIARFTLRRIPGIG